MTRPLLMTPYHAFPSTHWSLVNATGHASGEMKRAAMDELLRRYLPALKSYLVCGRRLEPDRAEDYLQSFLADKVLEEDLIRRAERERGRFRNFLMVALDRFILNKLRDERALKRSTEGGVSLDPARNPADPAYQAGDAFDLAWARQVLALAVRAMREECKAGARPDVWGVFEARTLAPILDGADPVPYGDLVRRFGLVSPSQASNVLVTAHRMFGRVLKTVISTYEKTSEEVDDEVKELMRVFSRGGAGSL